MPAQPSPLHAYFNFTIWGTEKIQELAQGHTPSRWRGQDLFNCRRWIFKTLWALFYKQGGFIFNFCYLFILLCVGKEFGLYHFCLLESIWGFSWWSGMWSICLNIPRSLEMKVYRIRSSVWLSINSALIIISFKSFQLLFWMLICQRLRRILIFESYCFFLHFVPVFAI